MKKSSLVGLLKAFSFPICTGTFLLALSLSADPPASSNSNGISNPLYSGGDSTYSVCMSNNRFNLSSVEQQEKTLFVITPTFRRAEQAAELTRLAQTLSLANVDLHWIVVEDAEDCSDGTRALMTQFGKNMVPSYTILAALMPKRYRHPGRVRKFGLPRGVAGRMAALAWITQNTSPTDRGVVYFADDDNAYDARLFSSELRRTSGVSMFPVGLLRPSGVLAPLVDGNGKVIGFVGNKRPGRKFPVDMAGFAFSLEMLHHRHPRMPYRATFEEDGFLRSLQVEYSDIEPLASNCTEILVWHTMTAAPESISFALSQDTNLNRLLGNMAKYGMADINDRSGNSLPVCLGVNCSM